MDWADEIIDSLYENTEQESFKTELSPDTSEAVKGYEDALSEDDAEYMNYWQQELESPAQEPTETYDPYEYERETLEDGVELEQLRDEDFSGEFTESYGEILGEPEEDAEVWHEQTEDYSCAVACQTYVAEQLFNRPFSEQEFIDVAAEHGWYTSGEGTSPSDTGKVLELMGLDVERSNFNSFSELEEVVASDAKAIVGVNNSVLQNPGLAGLPGMNANHAVEVIGIDRTDPDNIEVILNDPGVENGAGIRHSLDTFLKAWRTGSNYMCTVSKGGQS